MTQAVKDHALEFLSNEEALQVEDSLWWVQGRKNIISKYLELAARQQTISEETNSVSSNLSTPLIMDVGCGSGGNLDVLSRYGNVIGVEPSSILAERARRRNIATEIFEEDVHKLKILNQVSTFTLFDVLEHIEDDLTFLSGIRQKANQKHSLLVSVPACPALFSEHDRLLHHYRRYSKPMLRNLVEGSGYKVNYISYHMTFLFPLALTVRLLDKAKVLVGRKSETVEVGHVGPLTSSILQTTLSIESRLVGKTSLPIGLWLFALAESR